MAAPNSATEGALMILGHPASIIIYDVTLLLLVEVIKLIIAIVLVTFLWGRMRDFWELRRGKDNRHVSFSINYIDASGTLRIRTIGRQIPVEYLFPNAIMRRAVLAAAKRTAQVPKYPVMEFGADKKMLHDVMSLLRSWVTDEFREGFFLTAAGYSVEVHRFIIVPTFEQNAGLAVEQIRILVAHENLIKHAGLNPADVKVENPRHRNRLATLGALSAFYNFLPADEQAEFLLELNLPAQQ